jgi:uncharacterized cupredoxin-like copper-binding protein
VNKRFPVAAAALVFVVAGSNPVESQVGATANVVTVTAKDYAFDAPKTLPAGWTTIRLVNQGPEMHHLQLVRLERGRTMQQLLERMAAGEFTPEWATYVGGPTTPVPDGKTVSEVTVHLAAGEYAVLCFIPSPDGQPHTKKGMVMPLTVTAPMQAGGAEPRADVTMSLVDYAYMTNTALSSGRRTIKVVNDAEQPHEVVIFRLAPGKAVLDMTKWLEHPQGPPPGAPVAGTSALSKGAVNYVTGDFAPGEYALLCMIPDHKDGRPHIAHGMAHQITVR